MDRLRAGCVVTRELGARISITRVAVGQRCNQRNQNPRPYHLIYRKKRANTLAVICATFSSTRIELTQVIDPTEKTSPPLAVS